MIKHISNIKKKQPPIHFHFDSLTISRLVLGPKYNVFRTQKSITGLPIPFGFHNSLQTFLTSLENQSRNNDFL